MLIVYSILYFLQNKIARGSDTVKFEEEDLILKVGESLEASSLTILYMSTRAGGWLLMSILIEVS